MRELRIRLNETQAQFAARLGVVKLSLLKYETGFTCPTVEQLSRLESSGFDANYAAFGVPSLALPEDRKHLAAAYVWVKNVRSERDMALSDEILVKAAWLVFLELNGFDAESDLSQSAMRERAQEALGIAAASTSE